MTLKGLAKMLNTPCAERWKNIRQTLDSFFVAHPLEELFRLLEVVVYWFDCPLRKIAK